MMAIQRAGFGGNFSAILRPLSNCRSYAFLRRALLRATAYAPTTPTPSTLRFAWVWGAARGSSWRWLWPPRHKAEFAAFTAQPATCYCCYYVAGWLSRRDALLDDDCYSALPNSQYRSLDFLTRTWQAEVPVLAENSPVLCQLRHAHGMATPS